MNKMIFKNVLMNFVLMIIFVFLNNWALKTDLEETFISLALIYGIIIVIANAIFIAKFSKK
jgi:low temperature requirement protein LtrA